LQLAHQSRSSLDNIRTLLLPRDETDPQYREYLTRLSHPTIQIVALVEMSLAVLLHAGWIATGAMPAGTLTGQTAALTGAGALTLAAARCPQSRRYPRLLTAISVWISTAVLIWSALLIPGPDAAPDHTLAGAILVVVTAAAITPFLPWHALALGLSVEGTYILSWELARHWGFSSIAADRGAPDVFLILLAMVAAGIAAANYGLRRSEFHAGQDAVRVAETLTGAQLRAQLAESAISVGKMAAALSHEINSPLGALRSSVDTLLLVAERMADAPPDKREQLAQTRTELARSIHESAERIDEVSRRLRRFVSLEEAELKSADINDLIADVALLHRDEIEAGGIRVELDLEKSIPQLMCRPQLLTAVFSNLLSNAIHAVDGEGKIAVESRGRGSDVAISISDNGRGMKPEEVETIFDPSFKVAGSRVSSGNWSLFNSRQIIYEHGGEITLQTAEGEGTRVLVVLPLGGVGGLAG
jgi:signal transduction histidine kinase